MMTVIRLSSDGEGCSVEDLYKFPDQTGLLDRHARWREEQATFLESEVRAGVTSGLRNHLNLGKLKKKIWIIPYWDGGLSIYFSDVFPYVLRLT